MESVVSLIQLLNEGDENGYFDELPTHKKLNVVDSLVDGVQAAISMEKVDYYFDKVIEKQTEENLTKYTTELDKLAKSAALLESLESEVIFPHSTLS